ncbi:hypothetical protein GU926_08195 [Nibribacter ruber]|uniref:Uncharacterized protein n=1 Tax=Nibribacter ruber TaxID=2698458 RepID=A0A6P1NU70_9BACT|nr:hypothetical protein [Nibribacter ruber]QHL87416.1 hypothetical protein GU926_08195 [Nibribacter ruber]
MPDSLIPKPKNDTRLDRIYNSYIEEDGDLLLSEKDKEVREQLEAAWGLLVQYHSFEQAVPLLTSRFKISRATAYRVINQCTQLFGDVTQVSKQGLRHILYEYSMKVFQLAATQRPPDLGAMNRAIKNMAMLKGLDQTDVNGYDAELMEAHTYVMQLMTATGTSRVINLENIPETDYELVVDSVQQQGLGDSWEHEETEKDEDDE